MVLSLPHDSLAAGPPVRIARLEVWACRAPIETPVETAFGVMRDRPAVFVRLEDADGAFGFGEVWSNFPGCGAEHRARLIAEELAALVFADEAKHPADLFRRLSETVRVRVLQTGEPGPYNQAIAGLDMALWDLFARREGVPVRRALTPEAADSVPAYASGIDIRRADEAVPAARAEGYRAFKVKVGFALPDEAPRVNALAAGLGDGERLFADANQGWNLAEARRFVESVADSGPGWIEEPLPADAPDADWRALAGASPVPLAAGENIAGSSAFERAIGEGALTFLQPDMAKWGGFSGCFAVARAALAAGRVYCPHYLGGGLGLLASAHLLAAAGGSGLLEVDRNDNPMRREIWEPAPEAGRVTLGDAPGLGLKDLPDRLVWLATCYRELHASRL